MYVAAALLILAAGIGALFGWDMSAALARLAGRSQIVSTSSGGEEYALLGKGDPVLVVHGAGGGFDQGLDLTRALADQGYQLIAPSRFGYLGSALPAALTVEVQADAYIPLLDHLGVDKAVVLGVSAGAWSAIAFAIRHPERCRALVLLAPADYLPEGVAIHGGPLVKAIVSSDFMAWAAVKLMPVMPGALTTMLLGTDAAIVHGATASEKARVEQIVDHLLPVSARWPGMQFDIATAAGREPLALDQIRCPVLTISAEDDPFGTALRARLIAASALHGRAIIYPTGGHALVGRYDDALSAIIEFAGHS
jgi:2-hydroxy-6-oxonona-2,4-dienedioate hydrolase